MHHLYQRQQIRKPQNEHLLHITIERLMFPLQEATMLTLQEATNHNRLGTLPDATY